MLDVERDLLYSPLQKKKPTKNQQWKLRSKVAEGNFAMPVI